MLLTLRNILLGAIIILTTTAANAASVTLTNLANSQPRDGAYAGFYTLTVDGTNVLALCDDFTINTTVGENWTAYFNTEADIIGGAGKFYVNPPVNYNQVGYLFSLTSGATYTQQAAIDEAIWKIMDPAVSLASDADALAYFNEATNGTHNAFDYSNVMKVLTPDPSTPSQEFLVAVPLPSALWLLFSGMAGLFGMARRLRQAHTS